MGQIPVAIVLISLSGIFDLDSKNIKRYFTMLSLNTKSQKEGDT
jgi:hypothetical protein